ncbi:hypothetical protein BDM02DRAFT_3181715 [Thelephora ganbajun]|uniref:Uncharacterized protein n=1 Tax=Thelephora ganbajun TaxID=370292 RepID=A0ACB6Z2R1_THEGA|nr:hypothetical protein BDM02DRAFT_3181715 [Thelephora ganbajun]
MWDTYDPFPGGYYIHPFHDRIWDYSHRMGREHPRTVRLPFVTPIVCDLTRKLRRCQVVEMRMCALSNAIREKPIWWEKIKDPILVKKWAQEALGQQKDVYRIQQLTERMIAYVFQELHGYASIRDPDTGIKVGPYERIWRSDSLIPRGLRNQLISVVFPLEKVLDAEKDWHPRSDNQVLDLVHPSLYPIVYDHTFVKDPQTSKYETLKPPGSGKYHASQKFQWLPSDFAVAEDGTVTLASPHINNVHPWKHAALQSVTQKLLERAVPLWEHVLSDLRRPLLPFRTESEAEDTAPSCLFADAVEPDLDSDKEDEYDADGDAWLSKQHLKLPDARDKYTGDPDVMKTPTISLKGTTIQCIIKLVNIYYDCENITSSRLAFRRPTHEPEYHEQNEKYCTRVLYGIKRLSQPAETSDDSCLQELGSVETIQGHCVTFPNTYQHQVQLFRLEELTKPGFCKIFVAFPVDPTYTIPSVTTIAPQQCEVILEMMLAADNLSQLSKLPIELIDIISGEI